MLTVMLSTHNGAPTLPTVLGAYTRLVAPAGGWKLVVIDNGSTDETPTVLERFARSLPLTRLHVARPGKNHALNEALGRREGALVVFSDDDAVPASNWLVELERASRERPEYDLFGGAIVPRWDRDPEPWLTDWVPQGITFTLTEPEQQSGPIAAACVWGPNMAVRSSIFDRGHRFDAAIGPKAGTAYPMGSETEFTSRMERLGHRAWFVESAIVEHVIRAHQMERHWILSRAVRYGRGSFHARRLESAPPSGTISETPTLGAPRLVGRLARLLVAKLLRDERRAFEHAWALRCDWGYLLEARTARGEPVLRRGAEPGPEDRIG